MKRHSTSEYPDNWPDIALKVKNEADWKCVRCGHPHEPETGYCLTVHHLDLSPSNCEWWNIPALCQKCHLAIQGRVIMERYWMFDHSSWFVPYVAGYYAHKQGRPHDREYVRLHAEEILDREKTIHGVNNDDR